MSQPLLHLTTERLDPTAVAAAVERVCAPGSFGAVVSFIGTTRRENLGRHVDRLEYEAFEPLALKTLALITEEAAGYWPAARIAVHHRIGPVACGEASIVIAAVSPHRVDAFQACRYVIERVKQIVPIWKREVFEGGETWIEGSTADPGDDGARTQAHARACG
jgi:molybdopterin synthase catalytic subunit